MLQRSNRSWLHVVALCSTFLLARHAVAATTFTVDPEVGNSVFTAVFDSLVGERITAVGSAIQCTLSVDEQAFEGHATCSVPLTSIRVDNDDTKSEHFREWATNRMSDPSACAFKVEIPSVVLPKTMTERIPTPYTAQGLFTLCDRTRDDRGAERVTGTITYLPPGTYGEARTLRIRARIEHFDRERYGVSPKNTKGWLARVQDLAPVVGTEGTIEVTLFATSPAGEAPSPDGDGARP